MRAHIFDVSSQPLISADFPRPPVEGEVLTWLNKRYRVQLTEWVLEPKSGSSAVNVSMRVVVKNVFEILVGVAG